KDDDWKKRLAAVRQVRQHDLAQLLLRGVAALIAFERREIDESGGADREYRRLETAAPRRRQRREPEADERGLAGRRLRLRGLKQFEHARLVEARVAQDHVGMRFEALDRGVERAR